MKILVLTGIVAFIAFSVWYANRKKMKIAKNRSVNQTKLTELTD